MPERVHEERPLVSIITVVFNGEKYLEATIKSVFAQTYDQVEYIIIDGASTDTTPSIIRRYEEKIAHWVSEKDEGIYDAMNKGLSLASGKIIAILNADDWYEPNAVELSVEAILEHDVDYSYASVIYHDGTRVGDIHPLAQNKFLPKAYFEMPYPHITAFIKREIYDKIGTFDTSFKVAGDHDLALRIILEGYKGVEVRESIAHIVAGGVSSDFKANLESSHVARKHGVTFFVASYSLIVQYLKYRLAALLPVRFMQSLQKLKGSRFS